jgi:hypothetical protein
VITYKDMTFCTFNHLCDLPCERALNGYIQVEAKDCDLLISTFTNPPFDYDGEVKICDHQI